MSHVENLMRVKEHIIAALFNIDNLFEKLVLKGGTALDYMRYPGKRSSIDIDLSIDGDFESDSLKDLEFEMEKSIRERMAEDNLIPFDFKFSEKPKKRKDHLPDFWGGYKMELKVIEKDIAENLDDNLDAWRNRAFAFTSSHQKTFKVDFSKCEECSDKEQLELSDYTTFYAYTPRMLVIEKLRAICQQMEGYHYGGKTKTKRSRDFYDIHLVIEEAVSAGHAPIDLSSPDFKDLVRKSFEAKDVPLCYLERVESDEVYNHHAPDFGSVRDTVETGVTVKDFRFYYDYLIGKIGELDSFWNE